MSSLPTFEDGRSWLVDQVAESPGGRALRFVLAPNGRAVWVNLADLDDSPERRETIALELLQGRRYVRGARIAPPYPPPPESV